MLNGVLSVITILAIEMCSVGAIAFTFYIYDRITTH